MSRRIAVRGAFALLLVLAAGAGPGAGRAGGYRFIEENSLSNILTGPAGGLPPPARPLFSWDDSVWGPGQTLSFTLYESERWGFEVQEVRRIAEEALALWSEVATADIRWEVGRVAERPEYTGQWDDNVIVHADADENQRSSAWVMRSGYRITRCTIWTGWPEGVPRPDPQDARRHLRSVLVHELGHCLGLDHTVQGPPFVGWRKQAELPPWWSPRPAMLTDGGIGELAHDDRIGASLLRPRPGWFERTGSVWGNVLMESDRAEPAGRVTIVATRVGEDGVMVESLTRTTDGQGQFVIGGLPPGDYLLLVYPYVPVDWPRLPMVHNENTSIRAGVRAAPVRVRRGAATGPVTLVAQRGEDRWPHR